MKILYEDYLFENLPDDLFAKTIRELHLTDPESIYVGMKFENSSGKIGTIIDKEFEPYNRTRILLPKYKVEYDEDRKKKNKPASFLLLTTFLNKSAVAVDSDDQDKINTELQPLRDELADREDQYKERVAQKEREAAEKKAKDDAYYQELARIEAQKRADRAAEAELQKKELDKKIRQEKAAAKREKLIDDIKDHAQLATQYADPEVVHKLDISEHSLDWETLINDAAKFPRNNGEHRAIYAVNIANNVATDLYCCAAEAIDNCGDTIIKGYHQVVSRRNGDKLYNFCDGQDGYEGEKDKLGYYTNGMMPTGFIWFYATPAQIKKALNNTRNNVKTESFNVIKNRISTFKKERFKF